MNKNIGVVITDGVGVRNFILSDFLNKLKEDFEEVILYTGVPLTNYKDGLDGVIVKELEVFKETKKIYFFRKLKETAHLYKHRDNFGMFHNFKNNAAKGFTKRAIINRLIYLLVYIFHTESSILFFEKLQYFFVSKKSRSYIKQLSKDSLDILFFTHQRPAHLSPVLYASKSLGIKTGTFIFSWDNLASKGRMLGTFDFYLVWSNLMKEELLEFYPNTKKENIKVVGTPQFEPYVLDRYQSTKDEFINKFKLDVNKKIIYYSCADASIGKNDEVHIRAILSFLKERNNLQLLVRTSPAEDGKRFEELKKEFPEIIWNFPKWYLARKGHTEAWSQRLPSVEDVKDLKAILLYSDVNVNMLSTMSLDFMLFDKPVINTVFGNKENGLYDDQKFLKFLHYQYVVDSEAVTIAKNEKELHEQLEEAIKNPSLRKTKRKALLDLEIGAPLEGTSQRIVKALKSL